MAGLSNPLWLPRGHLASWCLHVEHKPCGDGAGRFTGGGWKLCWHITVSPWQAVDAMVETVIAKGAEPHFVIGGKPGREHPTVVQLLPLNVAGRSLQHTLGPETNRANCIQVEICAWDTDGEGRKREDVIAHWPEERYKTLGNLAELIRHRVDIPNRCARAFSNGKRFTAAGYPRVTGHHGHMHVPGNDHTDPTRAFSGTKVCRYTSSAPNAL